MLLHQNTSFDNPAIASQSSTEKHQPGIGLYLHAPFCASSCPYCDYPHAVPSSPQAHEALVGAMRQEMRLRSRFHGAPVQTLYLGGGTPSQLSAALLERLFETIHRHFDCSGLHEATLEANPDDLEVSFLQGLHPLGVNRLSLGVQSFFDEDLHFLGRLHDGVEAARALPLAREAGYDDVAVDLIFGLPTQSRARWQTTLEKAIQQAPTHVTLYRLTADPGTPLGRRVERGTIRLSNAEATAAQYEQALRVLEAAGIRLYEQTHLARSGFESAHTRRYWRHQTVLGFGPGAHSFFWTEAGQAVRRANASGPQAYTEALSEGSAPPHAEEQLAPKELADEYIGLRLRTAEGLSLEHFAQRYGRDLHLENEATLDRLRSEGYVERKDGYLRLTHDGRLRLDAIVATLQLE